VTGRRCQMNRKACVLLTAAILAAAYPAACDADTPLSYLRAFGSRAEPIMRLTWGLLIISIVVCIIIAILVVNGTLVRRDRAAPPISHYIAGTPYVGADVKMKPGPGGNRGELTAWDFGAGKPAWQIKEDLPIWSGTLATAGNLVFYGTMDGWFKPSTPSRASSNGSSRPVPESSASRSLIAALMGANISPFCPASAVGPARLWRAISIRAIR
jgi:hypothetical protein